MLPSNAIRSLLLRQVVVEEKLDGANVVLWLQDGRLQAATRGGPGAIDRAGQLGPLRAWAAQHGEELREVLHGAGVLYCEWLLLTHTLVYDRLPSFLILLDLLIDGAFADVDERDRRCAAVGLSTPPRLAQGVLGTVAAAEAMLAESAFGSSPAEGLIVRTVDGSAPRIAKLLRRGFERKDEETWRAGRPRNRLLSAERQWR